jgi:hypothetical protein
MPSGRKSLKDEIGVLKRYADLAEPYFRVLRDSLESEDKDERKWAADNLKTAFAKMIPQSLEGTGDNGEFILNIVKFGDNITSQLHSEALPAPTPTSD